MRTIRPEGTPPRLFINVFLVSLALNVLLLFLLMLSEASRGTL